MIFLNVTIQTVKTEFEMMDVIYLFINKIKRHSVAVAVTLRYRQGKLKRIKRILYIIIFLLDYNLYCMLYNFSKKKKKKNSQT